LHTYELTAELPAIIHESFLSSFKEYIFIGGIPAAIKSWIENKNLPQISQTQQDLLGTYRDDFNKYKGKISLTALEDVLISIPMQLGEKFTYSKVNKEDRSITLKSALQLLITARLCHPVKASHGNGVPLNAERRDNFFKAIFLDVGLISALLGLDLNQLNLTQDINLINQGKISEQVTGQLLRILFPFYIEPRLYYWVRETTGSAAEIDYLIQYKNLVIPIEVKSGRTGSLKSLHLFMHLKKLSIAVRINSDLPSLTPVEVKVFDGTIVRYQLLSIPFYLIEQLPRLLSHII
jgi:predicted AAA+ superfamily ATPase